MRPLRSMFSYRSEACAGMYTRRIRRLWGEEMLARERATEIC